MTAPKMREHRWLQFEEAVEHLCLRDPVEHAILRAARDAVEVVEFLCAECGSTSHDTIAHSPR